MNNVYIWYSKGTSVTGKRLRDALAIDGGTGGPKARHTHVIAWGPVVPDGYALGDRAHLNNPHKVAVYSNKYAALVQMNSVNVNVPNFALDPSYLDGEVVERTHHHKGGSGYTLHNSTDGLVRTRGKHFLEFVPSEREYRVHVFCGEVVRISRKVAKHVGADETCRSHANGWRFRPCDIAKVNVAIKEQAIQAVQALGYQFGGVDILYTRGGHATVLEVNSACGLDSVGLGVYVSNIKKWMQEVHA